MQKIKKTPTTHQQQNKGKTIKRTDGFTKTVSIILQKSQ